jgi:hypothetical protein
VPAAAAEQGKDGESAGQEMSEHDGVEELHRRGGHKPPEQHHGRREEERLRVGDAGVAAEMVGVPERQLAVLKRGAEIAQHRVEVVLGIPRYDAAGQRPHEGGGHPERENGERRDHHVAASPGARASILRFGGVHRRQPERTRGRLAHPRGLEVAFPCRASGGHDGSGETAGFKPVLLRL